MRDLRWSQASTKDTVLCIDEVKKGRESLGKLESHVLQRPCGGRMGWVGVPQNDILEVLTDKEGLMTFDKSHVCSCWRA